jgi:hypothetical protein
VVGPEGWEGVEVGDVSPGRFCNEKVQPLSNRIRMIVRDNRVRVENGTG